MSCIYGKEILFAVVWWVDSIRVLKNFSSGPRNRAKICVRRTPVPAPAAYPLIGVDDMANAQWRRDVTVHRGNGVVVLRCFFLRFQTNPEHVL